MFEFFNSIGKSFYAFNTICLVYSDVACQTVYNYAKSFNAEHEIFQACFYFNQCKAFIQNKLIYVYNNSVIVKNCTNFVCYCVVWLYAQFQYRRTEPFVKSWTCVSALVKSYYNYRQFNYKFNELYNTKPLIDLDDYLLLLQTVKNVVKSERAIGECLVTLKINDKYLHRLYNPSTLLNEADTSKILFEQSDVKFLSVEYHSIDYLDTHVLEINKNELIVNNEILSAAYIKRALEYQIPYHKFDNNYTVFLMDNNLNTVYLKHGEYIVLHKSYYSIMYEEGLRKNVYSERVGVTAEKFVANE